jgi:hypothetical protein
MTKIQHDAGGNSSVHLTAQWAIRTVGKDSSNDYHGHEHLMVEKMTKPSQMPLPGKGHRILSAGRGDAA